MDKGDHMSEIENERPDRSIFPTFFMAGFECSTFVWKDGQRKDFIKATGHDRYLFDDYKCVQELGIGVVREAIRWPLVDKGSNQYDWSSLDTVLKAIERTNITPIWDLFHYGLPDNCDPFSDDCLKRFIDYCRAATEYIVARTPENRFFTPINEINFFAAAASDTGWMYPFAKGRYADLKVKLCRMDIEAVKAIREIDKRARMVHVDPITHAVPPEDRPDLADESWENAYNQAYESWDMLYGRLNPELGGSPEILDIVGVNVYHFSQAELQADGKREVLGPQDPRRKPLGELLMYAWERYHRPMIIGETSGYQDRRAEWLKMTMRESLKALNDGIDLQGVCLYPFVDIPDWQTGEWAKMGLYDIENRETLERIPVTPYIDELRRWQKILDQPEHVSGETGKGEVHLDEVRKAAVRWEEDRAKRAGGKP
jgi:beta-glucosidase/6-phospho-beta-glucosidase/beta-galactosidase